MTNSSPFAHERIETMRREEITLNLPDRLWVAGGGPTQKIRAKWGFDLERQLTGLIWTCNRGRV